jgi:FkbM family methyltransferase
VFEPNPKILNHLRKNILINKFQNQIKVEAKAVTSTGKRDKTFININRGANSAITIKKKSRDVLLEVPHCSLDEYFEAKSHSGRTLIKIDVEGYELKVLQGAEKFISINKPIILVEFSTNLAIKFGDSFDDLLSFFRNNEYLVTRIKGTADYLAIPKEIVTAFSNEQLVEEFI